MCKLILFRIRDNLVWKSMFITKIFSNMFKNYCYFTLFEWNWNWGLFLQKSFIDGTVGCLRCIESKRKKCKSNIFQHLTKIGTDGCSVIITLERPKSYLFVQYLKNSIPALLRYVVLTQRNPILFIQSQMAVFLFGWL